MWGKRSLLREKDAWRVATAWKKELQGYVRLVTTHDRMRSAVQSYEWIEFDLTPGENAGGACLRHRWAAAQVASVVWTLMASCKGFSGRENPVFWRRVFCEYGQYDRGSSLGPDITDAIRFFPTELFPRYRLRVGSELLLGSAMEQILKDVKSYVKTLESFICSSRLRRSIDLSFSIQNDSRCVSERVLAVSAVFEALNMFPWADALYKSTKLHWLPRFNVNEVDISELQIQSEEDADALIDFCYDTPLRIPHLHLSIDENLSRGVIAHVLLAVMNARPPYHSCRVHQVSLFGSSMSDNLFGAVFSALPQSRSVETLELVIPLFTEAPGAPTSNHLWYWLDYANFHPEIAQSSWQNLEIGNPVISVPSHKLLKGLCDREDKPHHSDRAHVTLQPGSTILAYPALDSPKLCFLDVESSFDVCYWVKENGSTGDWICVVVPGFGYGWVLRESISGSSYKTARPSQLRGLSWWIGPNCRFDRYKIDRFTLLQVLERFGHNLQLLRASVRHEATANQVMAILDAAPTLHSLSINHDGSIWENDELAQLAEKVYPLREVELTCPAMLPSRAALDGPFVKLTALCINIGDKLPPTGYLKQAPRLQHLHLTSKYHSCVDYQGMRSQCRKELGDSKASSGLQYDCQVAFLSVLKHLTQRRAVRDQWEESIVRQIFDYVSHDVERDVWIDSLGELERHQGGPPRRRSFWGRVFGCREDDIDEHRDQPGTPEYLDMDRESLTSTRRLSALLRMST
ncbi:hypothetical protein Poli38472_001263 [Pythium oligandrum]|uniref:Uncharacterized protein n=1 Tax=Pythium oligandrum TaxID=41045 RepID=A0A8K1FRL0_PYTOL|nr:hypothetical protein Poli38472_001263 [Pythium oligandrum]|eukprot:TMW69107.1 hypothetical protein Poli38472_001263 [Pythium oligandrum]